MKISAESQAAVRRVYDAQSEDDERFAAAMPSLQVDLDLSGGVVTAMTCDRRFVLLLENWAASCVRHGIDIRNSTIVFPTDLEAHRRAESCGFISYFDSESLLIASMGDSGTYGDPAWTDYMYHQNWVIKNLFRFPGNVLFQDVDLVWRRDPRPFLAQQAKEGADIQAMYDGPNGRFQPLYANSGFMYFQNTPPVRAFWAEVMAQHDMIAYYRSQQEPLNVMLAAHAHRGLDVRILDEQRFANGHLYCGDRQAPDDPWVMHNSWTADLAEKLRRFEAFDLWFL